ncbi:MAG: hypothetical protein FVQ79_01680 [Planctomycetes bacterium]|nr:hypothetical protein [Planctomycetota bacterium]
MEKSLGQINPGQTFDIGTPDHLTQIQHKGPYVDVVDHLDKGPDPVPVHIVTRIDQNGQVDSDWGDD